LFTFKEGLKSTDRELTKQMLMNLELRKEYDRIKDQEQNVSAFELT
jgi:hypothetical protein